MRGAVHSVLAGLGPVQRRIGPFRRRLRILCYHGLWTMPGEPWGNRLFMPPALFEARMRRLAQGPYNLLGLGEAVERLAAGTLPDWPVAVTIDDGWSSTYTHMLPILERWRVPATVYVATWYVARGEPVANVAARYIVDRAARRAEWTTPAGRTVTIDPARPLGPAELDRLVGDITAVRDLGQRLTALVALSDALGVPWRPWFEGRQFHYMTPGEVGDAAGRGLDVQLHSHRHTGMGAADTMAREVEDNRAALAPMVGARPLRHFCYPSGKFFAGAPATLAGLGLASATTVKEGLNAPGDDPYLLRRFLDGRLVGEAEFDAYLTGGLELMARARGR